MKKVWNKETYSASEDMESNPITPKFYRKEDWGVEVQDDFKHDSFTTKVPLGLEQPVIPKQHFKNNAWVLDEAIDQSTIDAMTTLSKLAIIEALEELPEERAKFDMLMSNDVFIEKWQSAIDLEMNNPTTIKALALVGFDVDAVKRKIIQPVSVKPTSIEKLKRDACKEIDAKVSRDRQNGIKIKGIPVRMTIQQQIDLQTVYIMRENLSFPFSIWHDQGEIKIESLSELKSIFMNVFIFIHNLQHYSKSEKDKVFKMTASELNKNRQ